MKMSDTITAIATALAKAQGEIEDATKTGINPAFRSKYADLAAVRAVIREPLAVNDLSVMQFPRTVAGGVEVETMILHKSGEYMSESLFMPVSKNDAHGIGSGITYARRYGLMSLLCLAADDDDGNAAVEKGPAPAPKPEKTTDPKLVKAAIASGEAAAKKSGSQGATDWWSGLSNDLRAAIPAEDKLRIKQLGQETDAATTKEG
jgi:hypothetical protein